MTDKRQGSPEGDKPKIEELEVNAETVQDLTEAESRKVRGGIYGQRTKADGTCTCPKL
jgi:hypothetical protein